MSLDFQLLFQSYGTERIILLRHQDPIFIFLAYGNAYETNHIKYGIFPILKVIFGFIMNKGSISINCDNVNKFGNFRSF